MLLNDMTQILGQRCPMFVCFDENICGPLFNTPIDLPLCGNSRTLISPSEQYFGAREQPISERVCTNTYSYQSPAYMPRGKRESL